MAVVHWSWRIEGDKNFDGTQRPPRFGMMTMLAEKREGTWLAVVGQNTNATLGSPPELQDIRPPIPIPGAEVNTRKGAEASHGNKAVVKPHDDWVAPTNFYRGDETDEQWHSVFGTGLGKTVTLTRLTAEKQKPNLDCSLVEFCFNNETEMNGMMDIPLSQRLPAEKKSVSLNEEAF
jgi:hypothetical protein